MSIKQGRETNIIDSEAQCSRNCFFSKYSFPDLPKCLLMSVVKLKCFIFH